MLVIVLFILLLNIVSILLMYYCLGELGKKEKKTEPAVLQGYFLCRPDDQANIQRTAGGQPV